MIATSTYSPTVVINIASNYAADIYSLGCVYLMMWTVLRGASIDDLGAYTGENSGGFSSAEFDFEAWIARMDALSDPSSDNLPIEWIREMLQHDPKQRPTAHAIRGLIQEASKNLDAEHMFIGQCCLNEDTESALDNAKSDIGDDQQDDDLSRLPSTAIHPATHQEDRRLINLTRQSSSHGPVVAETNTHLPDSSATSSSRPISQGRRHKTN